VQRDNDGEEEEEPEMVISVAEAAWGWERVQQGFQRHRQEVRTKVETEFTPYAIRAKEGAQSGVSNIFQPYEEDLIWDGVDASATTGMLGLVPEIGGMISAAVGTIMAAEMARRNIQLNRLKGSISSRLDEEINAQLIDEDTAEREQLMSEFERKAAERYLEILNERGRDIVPESDEMKDNLVNYIDDEIVTSSAVAAEWRSYVEREYGPLVDEVFREPEPRECPSCHDILREAEEAARQRRMEEAFESMESLLERESPTEPGSLFETPGTQPSPEEIEVLRQWIQSQE
jgi:hypothetical protein